MERLLLATLIIVTMAGCRGDKQATLNSALSQMDNGGKAKAKYKSDEPVSVASSNDEVKPSVVAAVKQLKSMIDANVGGANPKRVEGKLIINSAADEISLRKIVGDDVLYSYLDQKAESKSIAEITKLNLGFEDARLHATGLSDDANLAVDALLKRASAVKEVEIPIVLLSHKNFLGQGYMTQSLSAMVVTDNAGNFVHFKLFDEFKKPVGKIIMPVTESTRPEDQKMILEYTLERNTTTNARLVEVTEYVAVLHVVPVKL